MKTENGDPMNTEQLKTDRTKEEILQHHYVHDRGLNNPDYVLNAMQDFASQESKRAVDEFKEKLKKDILSKRKSFHVVMGRASGKRDANLKQQYNLALIDVLDIIFPEHRQEDVNIQP